MRSQANESTGQVDALTVLNTCKTADKGDSGGPGARLDAGGANCNGVGPDSHANQSDASSGHRNVPDIHNSTNTTADTMETISTRQNALQMQNLPVDTGRYDQAKPRSCAGMPNMRIDMHGVTYHANTAGNTQQHISTWPADPKPQDLPTGCTRPCRNGMDGLESCLGMQMACVHIQDIADKSNTSENMSIMCDLPANGTKPCIGESKWLESPANASDTCT